MPVLADIVAGTATSLLELSGVGFDLPLFSLRGLTASLSPIDQSAQIERDVNGNLMDLSAPELRKYHLTVSCADYESPGFAAMSSLGDGVWPGSEVTVTLPPQLGSANPLTLDMMVTRPWSEARDEYGGTTAWQIEFEEL